MKWKKNWRQFLLINLCIYATIEAWTAEAHDRGCQGGWEDILLILLVDFYTASFNISFRLQPVDYNWQNLNLIGAVELIIFR